MLRHSLVVFCLCLCVFCQLIDKKEGSRCTWKEARGVCVSIFQCESSQIFINMRREIPPICKFKGKEPIICCTDCARVDDVRKLVFNPRTELLSLTEQKANDKCVNFIDKLDYDCKINTRANYTRTLNPEYNCYYLRVITEEIPVEMPAPRESYLALLGYGADKQTAEWLCAGTIISDKFILTAAHCLSKEKLGPVKYIAVGIHKRTDPPEMWQKYSAKRLVAHPEYQPPAMYNDIALVETEKMITFSREVLPACLHSDIHFDLDPEANILVWDKEGKDQGTFTQTKLQEFHETQCSFFYPPQDKLVNGYNELSQSCYGDTERPMDSCQSDGGSPLISISKRYKCAPSILGVSSFDRTCGTVGSAQLFTKVLRYIPWIESIVWP